MICMHPSSVHANYVQIRGRRGKGEGERDLERVKEMEGGREGGRGRKRDRERERGGEGGREILT